MGVSVSVFVVVIAAATTGAAQPAGPWRDSAPPPAPAPFSPGGTDMPLAPHVEEPIIAAVSGGLTSEQAARRAVTTSFQARAAEANATVAAKRTEQAKLDYFPQTTLTAKYTHLSALTSPVTTGGVETTAPAGTVNPPTVASQPSPFPLFFNQYLLQANVTIPISDYFLKVGRTYTAATKSEDAARYDVVGARAHAFVTAKQAYYGWLRGRGALTVAEQTLAVAQAHASDARIQFKAGTVSTADVLRAESVVAGAEAAVERARAHAISADWNVRTLIHANDDEKIEPGETLDGPLPSVGDNVRAMLTEAYTKRAEIKSLERNIEAARKLADVAGADRVPSLSAFGDIIYANPNTRVFPPVAEFVPTWQVGALLTWSPKKYLAGGAATSEQESRAAALEAQLSATRDGIVREVVDAYNAARAADAGVGATTRQLDAAREAYRVSRVLYNGGRTTGTTMLDAEYALAQARFDHLNARADARVARVQLEHALGRDIVSVDGR